MLAGSGYGFDQLVELVKAAQVGRAVVEIVPG